MLFRSVITRPCEVTSISDDTFRIILTQGMNRQIRRMTKAFGYQVMDLERIRLVNITLESLADGEWRRLTELEVNTLKAGVVDKSTHSDAI